jgi:hypothetical protein
MHSIKRFFWFTRFFIRCGGWAALIPLVLGVSATLESLTLLRQNNALTDHGLPAQAIVLDLRLVATLAQSQSLSGANRKTRDQKNDPSQNLRAPVLGL